MLGQWHPAIQRLIRALDAERAAGRNRHDPVSRDRIEKAGEETDGALSDAALADVAAGEAGDRVWIDGLRPVLAFWRRTGHLELPKTVDGKPWGPERWLRGARANPATPDWVSAALNLLVDTRAREIPASLAEAVVALAKLRRIQAAEPAAPAELVRAQEAAVAAGPYAGRRSTRPPSRRFPGRTVTTSPACGPCSRCCGATSALKR